MTQVTGNTNTFLPCPLSVFIGRGFFYFGGLTKFKTYDKSEKLAEGNT
jgi:hypothetical protein